jgi:hypothetical protein
MRVALACLTSGTGRSLWCVFLVWRRSASSLGVAAQSSVSPFGNPMVAPCMPVCCGAMVRKLTSPLLLCLLLDVPPLSPAESQAKPAGGFSFGSTPAFGATSQVRIVLRVWGALLGSVMRLSHS